MVERYISDKGIMVRKILKRVVGIREWDRKGPIQEFKDDWFKVKYFKGQNVIKSIIYHEIFIFI